MLNNSYSWFTLTWWPEPGEKTIDPNSQIELKTSLMRRLFGDYCISSQKLAEYKRAFEAIFEIVDDYVTDGLTDLRLFAMLASLAQKNRSTEVNFPRHGTLMNFNSSATKEFKGG
ncbi:Phospholipase Abhd3 [Manis pentadactyla]|nr:Phospholipase Abhd3 [Manis pentadactyla]